LGVKVLDAPAIVGVRARPRAELQVPHLPMHIVTQAVILSTNVTPKQT
jgi:hypothetical protein